jgi:hypothetical protein
MADTEPTNKDRAAWAYKAIRAFVKAKGEVYDDTEIETEIQDLISDLLHLAHESAVPCVQDVLDRAQRHYEYEVLL